MEPERRTEETEGEDGITNQGEEKNRGYGPWMLVQSKRKTPARGAGGPNLRGRATVPAELATQRDGQGEWVLG